jgi:hypothetical protein
VRPATNGPEDAPVVENANRFLRSVRKSLFLFTVMIPKVIDDS